MYAHATNLLVVDVWHRPGRIAVVDPSRFAAWRRNGCALRERQLCRQPSKSKHELLRADGTERRHLEYRPVLCGKEFLRPQSTRLDLYGRAVKHRYVR